ncbi:hypothetical protein ATCV1_z553R [Acanthocystis turfacea chlorella virus 1]|uniref:Uncharacterized protein z553R n=1 Tax=Chlorovirus heliozoae TaxID=322019 RepID=A7K9G3_9PHYC|nr:hypothetical protein ATCV1_z553R [Acanthocystis turfacea chlorella virus 1]ABT16687.1 hypothetical protein ATCV1_z553R [Acanthocystis turfacea chlorella virus 1]
MERSTSYLEKRIRSLFMKSSTGIFVSFWSSWLPGSKSRSHVFRSSARDLLKDLSMLSAALSDHVSVFTRAFRLLKYRLASLASEVPRPL